MSEPVRAPYKASIEIDLWVWDRARAWAVLDQIVSAMEKQQTNDQGGVAVHHNFVRADLLAAPKREAVSTHSERTA